MPKIDVIMYHQIGRFKKMSSHKATYCDVKRFENQLRLLKFNGFKSISMGQLYLYLKGEVASLPEKCVVLTFDDGYENFYEYALPLLQKYGFTAVVYVLAGKIGEKADWLEKDGHYPAKLMSLSQIRDIIKYGIEIGSHGYSHLRLTECEYYIAKDDIIKSKKILEDLLGCNVDHFCYPYGYHNIEIMRTVKEAGYLTAVTCERATLRKDVDPFAIPRKAVSYGDSLLGFAWKIFFKNRPKRELLRLDD
ncbi:MAG: polysaccharide deacetylase family protein [Calditerrivibrio sp.]|nr:polysaccharide deacetylase family protein [Calditerrivibrio sp.]